MIKKAIYGLSVIILSMAICFALIKYYPANTIRYVTSAADGRQKNVLEQVYDVNFIMSKVPSGNMMIFLPGIKYCEFKEAEEIAKSFGMDGTKKTDSQNESVDEYEYLEFDDRYIFTNESGILTVYKYGSQIEYENTTNNEKLTVAPVSETMAADSCARFIIERFPDFTYEEAEINFDEDVYEITYIGRLANLRNYAFPNSATVGSDGEIIRLCLSFNSYDKLSDTRIKSMADAFLELPVDFDEDLKIDLKKCALVYHYQDSLIQPAYMFEGEIAGGRNFKCFVNAAMYKY